MNRNRRRSATEEYEQDEMIFENSYLHNEDDNPFLEEDDRFLSNLDESFFGDPVEIMEAYTGQVYPIQNVSVKFPYEAYPCQIQIMNSVIAGLIQHQNCLIESPTGTGKTAALLCSLIAWQNQQLFKGHCENIEIPIIYYFTRTHSQIKQVVEQLRTTEYKNVPMSILSSKKHTCINDEVLNLDSNIDDECFKRRQNTFLKMRQLDIPVVEGIPVEGTKPVCKFTLASDKTAYLYSKFRSENEQDKTFDIEDLKKYGHKCGGCPYYGAKNLASTARIIFAPYNYVLYPWFRRAMGIEVSKNIIVFDEAHNIENICRDVSSVALHEEKIRRTQSLIHEFIDKVRNLGEIVNGSEGISNILSVYDDNLSKLSKWIRDKGTSNSNSQSLKECESYIILDTDEILKELEEIGFGKKDFEIQKKRLKTLKNPNADIVAPTELVGFIEKLTNTFKLFYRDAGSQIPNYKAAIIRHDLVEKQSTRSNQKKSAVVKTHYEFKLMCMNPALAFKKIASAHSIILASGTLSPIESLKSELGVTFDQVLQADHVINPNQVWSGICTEKEFVSRNRKDPHLQDWLGQAILRICEIVPNGVLVFLPSYKYLNTLLERWSVFPVDKPMTTDLLSYKEIYIEQGANQPSEQFRDMMKEYKANVKKEKGCVLFAVFRGKVSEGVDFKDEEARAVVSIGIPNLPYKDCEIVCKKKYNNSRSDNERSFMNGKAWYECQGYRAINQAIGRCIRHKDDWGSIVFLDSRINNNKRQVSTWIRNSLYQYEFEALTNNLQAFIISKISGQ